MRSLLVAAIATSALGCGIFSTDEDRLNVQIQFQQVAADSAVTIPVVQRVATTLQVTYKIETANVCHDFTGRARQAGPNVELEVTAINRDPTCPAGPITWAYIALITGIDPASVRVGITNDAAGTRVRTEHVIPVPTS